MITEGDIKYKYAIPIPRDIICVEFDLEPTQLEYRRSAQLGN